MRGSGVPPGFLVSVGGVVLGSDSFGSGDGALGTARFSIQPGLAERGQLLVTQFAYRPVGGGEIVTHRCSPAEGLCLA